MTFVLGATVVHWLALSPHEKQIMGSKLTDSQKSSWSSPPQNSSYDPEKTALASLMLPAFC